MNVGTGGVTVCLGALDGGRRWMTAGRHENESQLEVMTMIFGRKEEGLR